MPRKVLEPPQDKNLSVDEMEPIPVTPLKAPGFRRFASMDIEIDGIDVGAVSGTKVDFETVGDTAYGVLTDRRQLNMPDKPWLYKVHNIDGEFSFWGSTIIDKRMDEVPDNVILIVQYLGQKQGKYGGRAYKDYRVVFFHIPDGFDNELVGVELSGDGKRLNFRDRDLKATAVDHPEVL